MCVTVLFGDASVVFLRSKSPWWSLNRSLYIRQTIQTEILCLLPVDDLKITTIRL